MTEHDSDRELLEQITNYIDGRMSAAEVAELEQRLLDDPQAFQLFNDYSSLHAQLAWTSIPVKQRTPAPARTPARTPAPAPQPAAAPAHRPVLTATGDRPVWREHPYLFCAVAASLTLAFWAAIFWILLPGDRDGDLADEYYGEAAVAFFSGSENAVWDDTTQLKYFGRGDSKYEVTYYAGDRLHLRSGVIRLRYATGAVVILKGPAEFWVGSISERGTRNAELKSVPSSEFPAPSSKNSGFLALGSLVARCESADSKGFTVEMPHARVTDLGTEFAVEVQSDGAADVVVLSGEVELISQPADGDDGRRVRLTKGQGASIDNDGGALTGRDKVDAKQFADLRERIDKDFTPPAEVATRSLSVYYRADNVDGRGNPGNRSTTRLVNLAAPGRHDGTIVDGSGVTQNSGQIGTPFEYGVALSGANQTHIQASSFQIAGGTNKVTSATWEFWLKADRGNAVTVDRGVLSGEFEASGHATRHFLRLLGIGKDSRYASYDEFPGMSGINARSDPQLFDTSAFTQIVVTKSGDTLRFYRNGAAVGTRKSHAETYSGGGITQTLFGKRASQNESFDGQFNVIRVYERALGPREVNANYRAETVAKAEPAEQE